MGPLNVKVYRNLDDLSEEDDEYDTDHLDEHSPVNPTAKEMKAKTARQKEIKNGNLKVPKFNAMDVKSMSLDADASKSMPIIKRKTTWSKLKSKLHKKLSDEDDEERLSDSNQKKLKTQRKLKKHNTKKW